MGIPIQICIWFKEAQIQSSAHFKGIQIRTRGRLRHDILSRNQDDHLLTPTWGHGNWRPRARVARSEDDIPTRRLGRRYPYVSTDRLHDNGGGRSPHMSTEENPLWLKTCADDVVLEIWYLHLADRLHPIGLWPIHVHPATSRWVLNIFDPLCWWHAHCC